MANQYEAPLAHALTLSFESGDNSEIDKMYADEYTYAGWNLDHAQQIYSKDEFADALKVLETIDEFSHRLVKTWSIGEDIVVAEVDAYRRSGEISFRGRGVNFFRFTNGRITHAGDMCPAKFEEFWDKVREVRAGG